MINVYLASVETSLALTLADGTDMPNVEKIAFRDVVQNCIRICFASRKYCPQGGVHIIYHILRSCCVSFTSMPILYELDDDV